MKHACTWYVYEYISSFSLLVILKAMYAHAFHICICPNKSSNRTKTYTDPKMETDQRKFRILTSQITEKVKTDKYKIHINKTPQKKRNKAEYSSALLFFSYFFFYLHDLTFSLFLFYV